MKFNSSFGQGLTVNFNETQLKYVETFRYELEKKYLNLGVIVREKSM